MKIYTSRRLQSDDTIDVLKKFEGTKLWVLMYDKEYGHFQYHRIEKLDGYQIHYLEYYIDPFITMDESIFEYPVTRPIKVYESLFCPEIPFQVLTDEDIQDKIEEKRSR